MKKIHYQQRSTSMGADDKIRNAGEKLAGKSKEAAGKLTGNEKLEAEGKMDQGKSDLKSAGEKVKDAFKKD
jgi:uncharacterized protein YjbJ (UPF0337 family)